MSRPTMALALSSAVLVILIACGGESTSGARTVEIKALDTLRFEPDSVNVNAKEAIRFVVTNVGKTAHEFVLGDDDVQAAHDEMSGTMDHSSGHALAALDLDPGETDEVTVTFDQAGKVLFACHEPGHYKGGMVGTVMVT